MDVAGWLTDPPVGKKLRRKTHDDELPQRIEVMGLVPGKNCIMVKDTQTGGLFEMSDHLLDVEYQEDAP